MLINSQKMESSPLVYQGHMNVKDRELKDCCNPSNQQRKYICRDRIILCASRALKTFSLLILKELSLTHTLFKFFSQKLHLLCAEARTTWPSTRRNFFSTLSVEMGAKLIVNVGDSLS